MLIPLPDATRAACGGKAATLAVLVRAGFPVPAGFVVPYGVTVPPDRVRDALDRLGGPAVAVRSSAADEDTVGASAAGQYDSVIGVRGAAEVCDAIAACRASAHTDRVAGYRRRTGGDTDPPLAVLVQRLVEADVSGVLFTPEHTGGTTRLEASWGLGGTVVGGAVTPDAYRVGPDGTVDCRIGRKDVRTDLDPAGHGVATRTVGAALRTARALDDTTAARLAALGNRIAARLHGPYDVEWAIAGGTTWILQARPITAALPPMRAGSTGTPGSPGVVTSTARVVHSPTDFARVRPGDIAVCRYTDPAWTPLFAVAAGVVTETGGTLAHAAIVAREYQIPAVLGVDGATTRFRDGDLLTVDGTAGTVTRQD